MIGKPSDDSSQILAPLNWLPDKVPATRQQRYRATNQTYREREAKRDTVRTRDRSDEMKEQRHETQSKRSFIGWDTEGTNVDATPFLFGCSTGDRIAEPRIPTKRMFDLILAVEQREPTSIHVIYGGEYDFNMMLRDLPIRNLLELRRTSKTKWEGYRLEHIPRKWFVVSKNGVHAKIFDVISFFAAPYIQALEEHKVGTDEQRERIRQGKEDRRTFTFEDLNYIEPYWWDEVQLLPVLMAQMRESFYRAGVYIHHWHGPGAIARYMLREHRVKESKSEDIPSEVHVAARYAFAGGRFESFQAGLYEGEVWNADINSAYPYAATMLPNLSTGRWRHVGKPTSSDVDPHQFSVHHIKYLKTNRQRDNLSVEPQPLFRRFHDDRVTWPNTVTGWYWAPEASNIVNDPHAEILESWVFEDDGSRPFGWLQEYYDHRLSLQRMADPMELAFKLGPNSVYGQLAQRAGWERSGKAPPYHQIEWAGYVTSWCRAMVHKAAMYCWEQNSLISIDTDGVFATCTIPDSALLNGSGSQLGQWKVKSAPGMLNWQSGVYWVNGAKGWALKKARGAPKGKIPFEAAMKALPNLDDIKYKRNEMIGYRYALRTNMDDWRYFRERDRSLSFGGSQFSKRWHNIRACRNCRSSNPGIGLHDLYPAVNGFGFDSHSSMHVLPWETNDHDRPRDPLDLKNEMVIESEWSEDI